MLLIFRRRIIKMICPACNKKIDSVHISVMIYGTCYEDEKEGLPIDIDDYIEEKREIYGCFCPLCQTDISKIILSPS